jgi:hypothetical protein
LRQVEISSKAPFFRHFDRLKTAGFLRRPSPAVEPGRPFARLTEGYDPRQRHRSCSHLCACQHRRDRRFSRGRVHGRMVHRTEARAASQTGRTRVVTARRAERERTGLRGRRETFQLMPPVQVHRGLAEGLRCVQVHRKELRGACRNRKTISQGLISELGPVPAHDAAARFIRLRRG